MKTPRFWYPQKRDIGASMAAVMLSPLSLAFRTGAWVRRRLAHPYRARVPVVCIGNVVAGGAGKTPVALALAALLRQQGQRPVFVTRGYGGKGQVTAVDATRHDACDVGDEALLLAAHAPTWAGADRVAAMRQAEPYGTLILLDDGLQNPHIAPTVSLLVIDGEVGIGNGRMIPAGPLRESLAAAAQRVAAVIIIGAADRQNLAALFSVPVFRARLVPSLNIGFPSDSVFVAFAGIGRPEKFYATARAAGLTLIETRDFPDHHPFNAEDINELRLLAESKGARLLTTEKDAVRLPPEIRDEVVTLPVHLVFESSDAGRDLVRLIVQG